MYTLRESLWEGIQLLKGMYNFCPPQPRYSTTRDVDIVIRYLQLLGSNDVLIKSTEPEASPPDGIGAGKQVVRTPGTGPKISNILT